MAVQRKKIGLILHTVPWCIGIKASWTLHGHHRLNNIMFDLEKERSKVQDLHDQVEAKESKIDHLDGLCKSLKTQLQTEVGANKQQEAELEECQLLLKNSNLERENLKNDLHELQTLNQSLKDKLHTFKKHAPV